MADPKKKMSVADILAAARKADSGGGSKPPAESAPPESAPPAEAPAASEPAAAEPVAEKKPAAPKPAAKPGAMSVADILAAARASDKGGAKPAAAAAAKEKPAPKPAAAEKPKPAAPAKAAAEKPAAAAAASTAIDTSSILAAARAAKPGPMSKTEAAKAEAPAKPAKTKLAVPPMPEKPAVLTRPAPAADEEDRRSFLGFFFGSFLAIGFTTLGLTNLLWLLGLARFMFPNIITEPPSKFKVGKPDNFSPGSVENKFKAQYGTWIVNAEYEGEQLIFALKSVCTHLGCTPNWLEAEQKFKCPCHGSGFYKDGINFEGPAPRPLERYAISISDDGQLEVDKARTFHEETGQWKDVASFVRA